MSYTLKTVTDTPWGSIDASTVTCSDWGVSYSTGSHIDGAVLNVHKSGRAMGEIIKHTLDGTLYPSIDDAKKSAYEAGLLAYFLTSSAS
ncbi:MAG: hypothetical protein E6R04_10885 [Spirochaetes bacterium]|nr:MAG: hypothetical protein E6R04_10885 [Spirochaetota bacterium]